MTHQQGIFSNIFGKLNLTSRFYGFYIDKKQGFLILSTIAVIVFILGLGISLLFSHDLILSLIGSCVLAAPLLGFGIYFIWPETGNAIKTTQKLKFAFSTFGRVTLGIILTLGAISLFLIVLLYSVQAELLGTFPLSDIRLNIFTLLGNPLIALLGLGFVFIPFLLIGSRLILYSISHHYSRKIESIISNGRMMILIFALIFLIVTIISSGLWVVMGISFWNIILNTLNYPLFTQGLLLLTILGISFSVVYLFANLFSNWMILTQRQKMSLVAILSCALISYIAIIVGFFTVSSNDLISFVSALLKFEFLQSAFVTAFVIGTISSIVGVFILLRGMVFLGQAIAHSAFAGAAFAVLLRLNPLLSIMMFSVASALGIGYVNEKKIMRSEVIIGVVFSFFMAIAVFFIGLVDQYTIDIESILFGNILLTSQLNLILLIIFSALIVIVLVLTRRELFFMTFDEEMARISGIPVRFLNYLFLILVSLTISVSLRAIGAILVFAMVITPAAAAYQWTFRLNRLIFLSAVFGVFSTISGLYFSYAFDLPSGSTIVVIITVIFILSFVFSPKRLTRGYIQDECVFCQKHIDDEIHCLDPNCPGYGITHKHKDEIEIKIKKDDIPLQESPTTHEH